MTFRLNGKLVNSHLYCDPKGGYKDFNDIKLTDAADLVKIACVDCERIFEFSSKL